MNRKGKLCFGEDGYTLFYCPGCDGPHALNTNRWTWNGDCDKPTFSPSVLVTGGGTRCHSYLREGRIEFLGDCAHALAGQTVDLPGWPNDFEVIG